MKSDKASLQTVANFLISKGYEVENLNDSNTMSETDLICSKDGHKYGIEVKERMFDSSKTKDTMCEFHKVMANRKLVDNGTVERAFLISLYTDNTMRISDIYKSFDTFKCKGEKTTYFENKNIVEKWFCCFKTYNEYKLEDGEWIRTR